MENYDFIIVGAGPAGLAAADYLAGRGKTLVIDLGRDIAERNCPSQTAKECVKCKPCNIMYGLGGAGGKSDGKLIFHPTVGGDLYRWLNEEESWGYLDRVDRLFMRYGSPEEMNLNEKLAKEMAARIAKAGMKFIPTKTKHIGSDNLEELITNFKSDLCERGVEFRLEEKVTDLKIENFHGKRKITGLKTTRNDYAANKVLLATGRGSDREIVEILKKNRQELDYQTVEMGVRVETLYEIMKPLTDICDDPKIHIYPERNEDLVRTFCTCKDGFVIQENYESGYFCVNGQSRKDKKTGNTNFALLAKIKFTNPKLDVEGYNDDVSRLFRRSGAGKPILQRYADWKMGRMTTPSRLEKSPVKPTLTNVRMGDIRISMPMRYGEGIEAGMDKLIGILPGLENSLLYAPEIKRYCVEASQENFQSKQIASLYFAGDGFSLSRGIAHAAVTGILAAERMAEH